MMSSGNAKEITLVSDDMALLEEGAELVQKTMAQIPGVIKIENTFDQSRIKGRLVVNSQKALGIGTSESAVAMQIYYLLNGMTATTVDYGDTEYDIILEYPAGKYDDITALMAFCPSP